MPVKVRPADLPPYISIPMPNTKKLVEAIRVVSSTPPKEKDDSEQYEAWLLGYANLNQDPTLTRVNTNDKGVKHKVNKVYRVMFDGDFKTDEDFEYDDYDYYQAKERYQQVDRNSIKSRYPKNTLVELAAFRNPFSNVKEWKASKTKQTPVLGFENVRPPTFVDIMERLPCVPREPVQSDIRGNWSKVCLGTTLRKIDSLDSEIAWSAFKGKGLRLKKRYLRLDHREIYKRFLKSYKASRVWSKGSKFHGPPLPPFHTSDVQIKDVTKTTVEIIAECALPCWYTYQSPDPRYKRWFNIPETTKALAKAKAKDSENTLYEAIARGYCLELRYDKTPYENPDNYIGSHVTTDEKYFRLWDGNTDLSYKEARDRGWCRELFVKHFTKGRLKNDCKKVVTPVQPVENTLPIPLGVSYHSLSTSVFDMRGKIRREIALSSESIATRYFSSRVGEVPIDDYLKYDTDDRGIVLIGSCLDNSVPKGSKEVVVSSKEERVMSLVKNDEGIYVPETEVTLVEGIRADRKLSLLDYESSLSKEQKLTVIETLKRAWGLL